MAHIRQVAPDVPVILDAKRGDIGSTAEQYAREAFERYGADAVTLSPFMGFDSIEPYLRYEGKGADPAVPHLQPRRRRPAGAAPGQRASCCTSTSRGWRRATGTATASSASWSAPPIPAEIERVRELAPTLPLLIPGVGAQGGDAAATRARRLARQRGPDQRPDHRQLVARRALCRAAATSSPPRRARRPTRRAALLNRRAARTTSVTRN